MRFACSGLFWQYLSGDEEERQPVVVRTPEPYSDWSLLFAPPRSFEIPRHTVRRVVA
jgi:hypothetical protein